MKTIRGMGLGIAAVIVVFVIKGLIDSKKPSVKDDYFKDFLSFAPLELKYSQTGEYEVSTLADPSDNDRIKKVRFWFPAELADNNRRYPVIVVVHSNMSHGSGDLHHGDSLWLETKTLRQEPVKQRLLCSTVF